MLLAPTRSGKRSGRRREFDARLSELVPRPIDEDAVRADLDPRLVTRLLFGMVNNIAEWYRPGGATSAVEVADALVALASTGCGARRLHESGSWEQHLRRRDSDLGGPADPVHRDLQRAAALA